MKRLKPFETPKYENQPHDRQSLTISILQQKCFLVEAHAWVLAGSVNAFFAAEREISGRCRHLRRGKLVPGTARFLCDIWRRNIDNEAPKGCTRSRRRSNTTHRHRHRHRHRIAIAIPPRSDEPAPPDPGHTSRIARPRGLILPRLCQLLIAACAHQQTSTLSANPPSEKESTPHPRHATAPGLPQSRDLTPARDLIHTAGRRRLSHHSNHSCQRIFH